MIQIQTQQVVAVGVFSFENEKAEKLLKQLGTSQILSESKKLNLYYEQELSATNIYQYVSMFQYAIYIVPEIEFSQKEWSNRNYMVLKLLQQFSYKQILLLFQDDQEINEKDTQISQQYQWVYNEINSIFNDYHLKDVVQNPLNLPIPEIKILASLKKQELIDFFCELDQPLVEQQLWLSIIKRKNKTCTAIIMSGYLTKNQTVVSLLSKPPEKHVINKLTDYFTQQEINYARQGDIIQIESEQSLEFLAGVYSTPFVWNDKVQGELIITSDEKPGFLKRYQKASFRFYYYGNEFRVIGQQIKASQKPNIYQTSFELNFPLFPPQIKDQFFSCFQVETKKIKGQMHFCCKMNIASKPAALPNRIRQVLIEKLITPPPEPMIINGIDYRQKCRVCKEGKPQFAPYSCGHLRYCADCQGISIESKMCLYCESPCTQMMRFDVEFFAYKGQNLKFMNPQQVIDYFSNDPSKEVPLYVELENQVNIDKAQFIQFNCLKCNSMITHYQFCNNYHSVLLCQNCTIKDCETCQSAMNQKQKIIYTFPDDPI